MARGYLAAAALLPVEFRRAALLLPEDTRRECEEFRLRLGRFPTLLLPKGEREIPGCRPVTQADLTAVLDVATSASAHAAAESIRRGFVTSSGGCRVGLCGAATVEAGEIRGLRALSSASIRVPREVRGCADGLMPELLRDGFSSTLIISPPGGGKTTLLREMIRLLSDRGLRAALCDERCELAGADSGAPRFDLGRRTDILSGAPKAAGAMLLLRSMNPEIIAMDEITAPEDVFACESCANCGVKLLATAHGGDEKDLRRRALYRQLLERDIFEKAVIISGRGRERKYEVKDL